MGNNEQYDYNDWPMNPNPSLPNWMQPKAFNDVFNPNDWVFEESSGYDGYRNRYTGQWIYNIDFLEKLNKFNDDKLWEDTVFRIIKLHTKSNKLTEEIVEALRKEITVKKKQ